jgi:glycosyltransferase involved in cell wall biosynthesis
MRPHLGRAAVSVAPIAYGAGIQNKVLEAMACRTPVVASPQAIAALDAVPGRDVLVAGDPAAFATEVLRLLDNNTFRTAVGSAGHRYVTANHRWDDSAALLEDVYYEAIQSVH